ncbi:MAG TPA: SAM-dependent methyltransferase [Candidatus Cloacimonadota bacterium]|nr:SAM-dependent methyltransferase [Candidatus Cloacimonadota bacterium]
MTHITDKSILYIVATPIGNPEDISLRALKVLEQADIIIGEERKVTAKLLRSLSLSKPIIEVNEHSTTDQIKELIHEMIQSPKLYAQVSDCGTPSFEDPGVELVQMAQDYGIQVIPVPGVSSLMTLIMVAGIPMKQFYYAGFLSPKKEIRIQEIKSLHSQFHSKNNIVILDTPYRLGALLEDIAKVFHGKTELILGYKLTMPEEKIMRFSLSDYKQQIANLPKGEFVLIIRKRG